MRAPTVGVRHFDLCLGGEKVLQCLDLSPTVKA